MKMTIRALWDRYRAWRRTLRANFILTILLLWVIPYIAVVSLAVYLVYDMQQTKIIDTVVMSADSSQQLCSGRIREAMNSSLSASYSPAARKYYESHIKQGLEDPAQDALMANLVYEQFKYDEKFNLTVLFFLDCPEKLYYTFSNTLAPTYKNIDDFRRNALEKSIETSERVGTQFGFFSADGKLYMVRNLFLAGYEPYAVLVMELDQETVFGSMDGIAWLDSSMIRLDSAVRTKGEGASALGRLLPGSVTDGSRCIRSKGVHYVTGSCEIGSDVVMTYAIRLDDDAISAQNYGLLILLAVLLLMLIPMLMAITGIVDRKIVRPINRLVGAAAHIERGEWGYAVSKESGSTEFEHLTGAFNHMSGQLGAQAEKMYAEELALRDAKIMALQSQINPHFLNNTLEIINWEARLGDTGKVSRMLEALGTMLEAALDRVKRPVVHLSEELVYVDAYLYIITERFGKRLEVEKRIDESLLDLMVPRLVMQPILENAVEHGVAPRHRGRIIIDISADEEYLNIIVYNDGALSRENQERIHGLLYGGTQVKGSINLGIRNVNERIKIICGDDCGLDIHSTENDMTASVIKLKKDLELHQ